MKRILAALLSFALCLALLFFVRNKSDEPILHVALKSSGEQDAAYVCETVYASGKSRRCNAFRPDTCVFYTADYAEIEEIEVSFSDTLVNLMRFENYDFWTKVKSKFL